MSNNPPSSSPPNAEPLPADLENYMKSVMNVLETGYHRYIPQVTRFISSFSTIIEKTDQEQKDIAPSPIGSNSVYSKDLPTKQYGALCIGTGGIKGILQAGALHEFWVRGQLKNLTYYAGSSVGSILTAMLCIGYEPIDLLTALCATDFSSQFGGLNFMNLASIYGLYPSSTIRKKIEQMILLKLGYLPTFADVYHKMNKVLIIPIYCLSEPEIKKRKIYCSYKTTPDMLILDAIVISCSVPIIFQKAVYKDKIYIDGAYTSVFPITALQEAVPSDCNILGITLKSDAVGITSFIGYIISILMIPLYEQDTGIGSLLDNTDIIELNSDADTSSINFTLNSTQKMNLFSSGTKQIRELINFLTLSVDNFTTPLSSPLNYHSYLSHKHNLEQEDREKKEKKE